MWLIWKILCKKSSSVSDYQGKNFLVGLLKREEFVLIQSPSIDSFYVIVPQIIIITRLSDNID